MLKQRNAAKVSVQAPGKSNDIDHWMDLAACRDWDFKEKGDPFFPISSQEIEQMEGRQICATCPVAKLCLDRAMESRDSVHYGIYAGTTGDERVRFKRRQQRAESKARE